MDLKITFINIINKIEKKEYVQNELIDTDFKQ